MTTEELKTKGLMYILVTFTIVKLWVLLVLDIFSRLRKAPSIQFPGYSQWRMDCVEDAATREMNVGLLEMHHGS